MVVAFILGAILFSLGLIFVTEYKPGPADEVALIGNGTKTLKKNSKLTITTWNIGYAGLGAASDFFMDGGKNVVTGDEAYVKDNLSGIEDYLVSTNSDIIFLQEVDRDSKRTYSIHEEKEIQTVLSDYQSSMGFNFRCLFVPYPWPPIGRVNSGIQTLTKFDATSATRLGLPNPFSWPVRAANLKRCLLENRIPIEGSNKELVIYNLHLEAYDDGDGKKEQTERLAAVLDAERRKGNYVIAGGDFNQIFSNVDSSNFPNISDELWQPGDINIDEFRKGFNFYMDENEPTCRSLDKPYDQNDENFQYYIIDGFILSENITVDSISTDNLGFKNSDHNPVNLKVTLN